MFINATGKSEGIKLCGTPEAKGRKEFGGKSVQSLSHLTIYINKIPPYWWWLSNFHSLLLIRMLVIILPVNKSSVYLNKVYLTSRALLTVGRWAVMLRWVTLDQVAPPCH